MSNAKFLIAGALALLGAGGYKALSSKSSLPAANTTVGVPVDQQVTVTLEHQPGCELGDMNVIVDHLAKQRRSNLILTVESLTSGSKFAPLVYPVSLRDLVKGKELTHIIKLSGSGAEHDLGIFLCSDAAGTKSCMGKEALDMEHAAFMTTDRSRETVTAKKKLTKGETPDAVFFFQYGRLSDQALRLTIGPSGDGREAVAHKLADRAVEKFVSGMLEKTTSMSIEVAPLKHQTVMRMPLKFYEEKFCEKESLRQHRELVEQEKRLRQKTKPTKRAH